MTNIELTPAFLIHRRTYQGNSLLLDFLTRDYGKIRLVARGIRKNKTAIQMFQCLRISFKGRGELKTLANTESADVPRRLLGNDLVLAIYANELLSRLLPEAEAHPGVFTAYQRLVEDVSHSVNNNQQLTLRLFENQLLEELGYGLDFRSEFSGESISPEVNYRFAEQEGFIRHVDGKIPGEMLLKFAHNATQDLSPAELKAAKGLNRQRLRALLGDKPLNSRELFIVN
ncbi:MAG: DNA repair protein RecO [Gammaproteobacteria bacterium]|nr:DNA repair protein RecO [Gammaproteobacteria bacterium]